MQTAPLAVFEKSPENFEKWKILCEAITTENSKLINEENPDSTPILGI